MVFRRHTERRRHSDDRVVNELTRRIHLIAMYPHIGRARDELNIGLRGFPAGDYVILYRVENEDVFILRVLHGRRDIAYLMDE